METYGHREDHEQMRLLALVRASVAVINTIAKRSRDWEGFLWLPLLPHALSESQREVGRNLEVGTLAGAMEEHCLLTGRARP